MFPASVYGRLRQWRDLVLYFVRDKISAVKTCWPSCSFFIKIYTLLRKATWFNYLVATSLTLCKLQSLCSECIHFFNHFFWRGNWFLFFPFQIENNLLADVLGGNFVSINKSFLVFPQWELAHCFFFLRSVWKFEIRVGADKSLASHNSRCRRTKSIVSLERGVCSLAELLDFNTYRCWRKHVRRRVLFQHHRDASFHQGFFFLQNKAPTEIHASVTERLGVYAPSYATVKIWVTQVKRGDFSPVLRLVLDDAKHWTPRRLLTKFTM